MQPVLRQLHWLPIAKRIMFKILLLTFKAINGLAPGYITEMLSIYSPSRRLRSSISEGKLLKPPSVRAIKTATYGDRAFSAAAPKLWNGLPSNIRAIKSLQRFKTTLKHISSIYQLTDCTFTTENTFYHRELFFILCIY